MKLEEFQTAKAALEAGYALSPGDARFEKLIKECDDQIAGYMDEWLLVFRLHLFHNPIPISCRGEQCIILDQNI